MELQSELACQDEENNLDQFIVLAIRIINLIHSRSPNKTLSGATAASPAPPDCEPMELDSLNP